MKANYISYDFDKSLGRLDDILNASNDDFKEVDNIPSRDSLTFTNGYYTNCTVLFVDIRDSSSLPSKHRRPVLAKIYRAYISEVVAILNGTVECREVNIEGDCVWGIFNTPYITNIAEVLNSAAKISSIVDILNFKLRKKGFEEIKVGIGIDYGRALMIKSGYSGSSINDIVWMGDVVNNTSKLCGYGNKTYFDSRIMISHVLYNNLCDDSKEYFHLNMNRGCYQGNVIRTAMESWKKENCN